MIRIERRNKRPVNRKYVVFENGKRIGEVVKVMGWYGIALNRPADAIVNYMIRQLVMDDLYWLLGNDCDADEWNESIEYWNKGQNIYDVSIDKLSSMFFNDDERELARNSINRK